MKINGLDKLQKRLEEIGDNARNAHGSHKVPLEEMLPDSFITKNTDFKSYEEFVSSPIFESYDSFEAIPDEEFDQFIRDNSRFDNWNQMLIEAGKEYTIKKLKL